MRRVPGISARKILRRISVLLALLRRGIPRRIRVEPGGSALDVLGRGNVSAGTGPVGVELPRQRRRQHPHAVSENALRDRSAARRPAAAGARYPPRPRQSPTGREPHGDRQSERPARRRGSLRLHRSQTDRKRDDGPGEHQRVARADRPRVRRQHRVRRGSQRVRQERLHPLGRRVEGLPGAALSDREGAPRARRPAGTRTLPRRHEHDPIARRHHRRGRRQPPPLPGRGHPGVVGPDDPDRRHEDLRLRPDRPPVLHRERLQQRDQRNRHPVAAQARLGGRDRHLPAADAARELPPRDLPHLRLRARGRR